MSTPTANSVWDNRSKSLAKLLAEEKSSKGLEGKITFVFGGSGGIGSVIASNLAARGSNIVIGYKGNVEKAQELSNALNDNGVKSIVVQLDVTSIASVKNAFNEANKAFGKNVDYVVNAAGISSEENVDETMAVNFKGAHHVMNVGANVVGANGSIVHITRNCTSKNGLLDAAKAAAVASATHLAKQNKVCVNTVSANVNTKAESIASTVYFLLSNDGSVSGNHVSV